MIKSIHSCFCVSVNWLDLLVQTWVVWSSCVHERRAALHYAQFAMFHVNAEVFLVSSNTTECKSHTLVCMWWNVRGLLRLPCPFLCILAMDSVDMASGPMGKCHDPVYLHIDIGTSPLHKGKPCEPSRALISTAAQGKLWNPCIKSNTYHRIHWVVLIGKACWAVQIHMKYMVCF